MPSTGLEPATPSLGGTCSNPTELREHDLIMRGRGFEHVGFVRIEQAWNHLLHDL